MGGPLQITSIVPFFLLMASFVITGYFLCRKLHSYALLMPLLLSKKGYYLELESMRGLLALSVVVHHALVWYFLLYNNTAVISGPHATFYSQLGTAPVTFFFFITGFLFWSKLITNPRPAPGTFMAARLRRLGPAYLAGAALMFTLVAIFTHFRLHTSPVELAHDALMVLTGHNPKLNGLTFAPWLWGVTWTLQFEFLFYMCIPFLGWFAQTLWKTILFIGGCNLLYAVSLGIDPGRWHLHGFYLCQALLRFFCFTFCIGFITAHLVKAPRIRQLARSVWVAPLAFAMIAVTMCLVPARYGPVESLCLSIPFLAMACGCDFWGVLRTRPLPVSGTDQLQRLPDPLSALCSDPRSFVQFHEHCIEKWCGLLVDYPLDGAVHCRHGNIMELHLRTSIFGEEERGPSSASESWRLTAAAVEVGLAARYLSRGPALTLKERPLRGCGKTLLSSRGDD